MRVAIISGIIILISGVLISVASHSSSSNTSSNKLSMATIQSDEKAGAQLIDVRTSEEYNAGFIDSAVNIPLADIQAGQLPTVAKDKKLYLYCHSGNRAAQAKTILQSAGYTSVTNLGGIADVVAIGGTQIK
jgi:phage shock protein E